MSPTSLLIAFSILFPSKTWFAPNQPLNIRVAATQPTTLVLLDFLGKPVDSSSPVNVDAEQTIDVKQFWPQFRAPGTFVLLAVPKGSSAGNFVGTPLVIEVRGDTRRDAPPGAMVLKVEPLRYAVIDTELGSMTVAFYYDVAPVTVGSFLRLSEGGFYDGLSFHRIVENFVIQAGDPRGDGTGGPGYRIEAEFSDRPHHAGVLSMARQQDPIEAQGAAPRPEFANSAGSQFFICLDTAHAKQLDGVFTAFGEVVDGMETVEKIGKLPTDPKTSRPINPPLIRGVRIISVTPGNNPYAELLDMTASPTTQP